MIEVIPPTLQGLWISSLLSIDKCKIVLNEGGTGVTSPDLKYDLEALELLTEQSFETSYKDVCLQHKTVTNFYIFARFH